MSVDESNQKVVVTVEELEGNVSGGTTAVTSRDRYLSAEQAAEYLNVSARFVRRAASARRLRHYRVGKFVRFDPADLDAFVTVREAAPGAAPDLVSEVWRSRRRAAR